MFGFFKKEKKSKPQVQKEVEELSDEEKTVLQASVEELKQALSTSMEEENQAESYEKLGLLQDRLHQTDDAISSLEKSLELKLSIGDGYKKLMSLYNSKRAEAARNGDDTGIEKYMNKMDDMRQIAKKVTLGG
ncbi:hypothetical protein RV11_GL000843 [Enterococcus phoeniculicola]|jgi:tetratricopeptide (TPR) repeat protein|uniref:Tetratricopeptide repeat protein n=1 Tax=Enterococcus phoeniculicola ATCC BAA-412 TaxID=1158610 RepID=R3U638_9ENTE|nr:hypothetical protein [Enterococcus phoeniculicola]EOL48888.1 hypothetical protein UC3_00439 [Enterococcus phoeniculicola ATCC BAA-412]EOT72734.1 hypothetical protein I589_03003 [Enterococcus phoeniculicola ATCC BAA-412]OJG70781.1 hypothetical protein RV11_GL000843 [Enterococcus phoeniculicola]